MRLSLSPQGRPLVTVQKINAQGAAAWEILGSPEPAGVSEGQRAKGEFRPLLSLPSQSPHMVFEEPLLAWSDSALFAINPLTLEVSQIDLVQGSSSLVHRRADPPLWLVPGKQRREYGRVLSGLGGVAAQRSALPKFWPSVRDFTSSPEGCFLVSLTAGENRQHIEVLTTEMIPLARFTPDGFSQPVFLSHGRAFVAEEGVEETVLYELDTDICPTG